MWDTKYKGYPHSPANRCIQVMGLWGLQKEWITFPWAKHSVSIPKRWGSIRRYKDICRFVFSQSLYVKKMNIYFEKFLLVDDTYFLFVRCRYWHHYHVWHRYRLFSMRVPGKSKWIENRKAALISQDLCHAIACLPFLTYFSQWSFEKAYILYLNKIDI